MILIYNVITREVTHIIEEEQGFLQYREEDHVVIQGSEEEVLELATLKNLIFTEDMAAYLSDEEKKLIRDKAFGTRITNRFLVENNRIELSMQDNLNQFSFFSQLKQMLDAGAIRMCYNMLLDIDASIFVVVDGYTTSEERKQSFITEFENYLGI